MEKYLELIFYLIIQIPVYVLLALMPYLTRKTESFGFSIPREVYNRPELNGMRKRYVLFVTVWTVLAVFGYIGCLSVIKVEPGILMAMWTGGYLCGSFVVYLLFHFQMKRLKTANEWHKLKRQTVVIDTQFRNRNIVHSNGWFIPPFLIAITTTILLIVNYPSLPDQLPQQYDFQGNITNTVAKSYGSVLGLSITQISITVLLLLMNVMIGRTKQQIDADRPKQSLEQNIIFRRSWSAFTIGSCYSLVLLFTLMNVAMFIHIPPFVLMIATLIQVVIMVAWAALLSFKVGQGGDRLQATSSEKSGAVNRDDDQYWKLGQVYCNPHDPAIFVEKRFGIGWTINVARPGSWLMLIGLLVIILIPIWLSR
ncbi:DUF1648 domain-containing protein [Desmospora activa]|uniref:Putative membrane protein n=1 Tax=Desmospora activa DSM 45169 TaxID=1121389 RepID=A0A2T4ZAS6_9BACL|nr:DUF5808 domain-containing protein [Desmospora activa]PTM58994.1 putative membrane protein [Desmospora activa DSM 45169]